MADQPESQVKVFVLRQPRGDVSCGNSSPMDFARSPNVSMLSI